MTSLLGTLVSLTIGSAESCKGIEWEWFVLQHQAFNKLKLALTMVPILKLLDFERQLKVNTNTSDVVVGAILR